MKTLPTTAFENSGRRARSLIGHPGALALLVLLAPSSGFGGETAPPAPSPDDFRPKLREPALDVGLLGGVTFGDDPAGRSDVAFAGGFLGELHTGRTRAQDSSYGLYLQAHTRAFDDVRFSLGPSGELPLGDFTSLSARLGPLLQVGDQTAFGASGTLEFGLRSLQFDSHYAMRESLFLSVDYLPENEESPTQTMVWIGLRVDAYWLSAPLMLLQL